MLYVFLNFPTEDFHTPEADDPPMALAKILEKRGIRGNFYLVGEKARRLRRRGRVDVIRALRKHCLGYHSNYHSIHPVPPEYLDRMPWEEGLARLEAEETPGMQDVKEIFGVDRLHIFVHMFANACQVPYVMANHGIPTVLSGVEIKVPGNLAWYVNSLHVQTEGAVSLDGRDEDFLPSRLRLWEPIYRAAAKKPLAFASSGVHPCRHVVKGFVVCRNCERGRSIPESQWTSLPHYSRAQTRGFYQGFADYMDHLRRQKGLRFLTYEELYARVRKNPVSVPLGDVLRLLRATAKGTKAGRAIGYARLGRDYVSAAELFGMAVRALDFYTRTGRLPDPVPMGKPLGPVKDVPLRKSVVMPLRDLLNTNRRVANHLDAKRRLPDSIAAFSGARIGPASYLLALCEMLPQLAADARAASTPDRRVRFAPASNRMDHLIRGNKGFRDWSPYSPKIRENVLIEQAAMQAWTAKPAVFE